MDKENSNDKPKDQDGKTAEDSSSEESVEMPVKFILGTKKYMTEIFSEDGKAHAVTVVSAGPMTVTGKREGEIDGYSALQVGYEELDEKRLNQADGGHPQGQYRYVQEVRLGEESLSDIPVGYTYLADILQAGDTVNVSGKTKGKGFQGVVKRHGFSGGRRSHGNKHAEREPGSIGATGPQEVFKGTRMAGRMGGDRITVKNLEIMKVDVDNNLLFIKGSLPGRKGTLLEIKGKDE